MPPPGIGTSTPHLYANVLDWVGDLELLADTLAVDNGNANPAQAVLDVDPTLADHPALRVALDRRLSQREREFLGKN